MEAVPGLKGLTEPWGAEEGNFAEAGEEWGEEPIIIYQVTYIIYHIPYIDIYIIGHRQRVAPPGL